MRVCFLPALYKHAIGTTFKVLAHRVIALQTSILLPSQRGVILTPDEPVDTLSEERKHVWPSRGSNHPRLPTLEIDALSLATEVVSIFFLTSQRVLWLFIDNYFWSWFQSEFRSWITFHLVRLIRRFSDLISRTTFHQTTVRLLLISYRHTYHKNRYRR